MARPAKEVARDTRRDILDAALDLFSEGGFSGTSMRSVARAVGVRESALYHHFESKEAIMAALAQELGPGSAVGVFDALELTALKKLGGKAMLKKLAVGLVELWATPKEQKFARLMLSEGMRFGLTSGIHPGAFIARAKESLSRLFQGMQAEGMIRPVDPGTAALAYMGPLLMLRMMNLIFTTKAPEMRALRAQVEQQVEVFWISVEP